MRHPLSLFLSVAIHGGVIAGLLWFFERDSVSPQEEQSSSVQSAGTVAFDVGKLIAAKQIMQQPEKTKSVSTPSPLSQAEPVAKVEEIPNSEVINEEPPTVTPQPIVPAKPVSRPPPPIKKKKVEKKRKKRVVKKKKKTRKKKVKKKTTPQKRSAPSATTSSQKAHTTSGSSKGVSAHVNEKASSDVVNAYRAGLQRAIARSAQRNYPREARRRRKQGVVRVRFTLTNSGAITAIQVISGSSSSALDKAAVKALRKLGGYKPPPHGFPRTLTVPIKFTLR